MTTRVVDASVVVKLFVDEPGSVEAERLVTSGHDLAAPELLLLEVANALHRKVRDATVVVDDLLPAVDRLQRSLLELHPVAACTRRAVELASMIDHPVYDCLYLALAEQLSVPLVTADRRFLDAAARAGHGDRIHALA